jgi:hypothetical protein
MKPEGDTQGCIPQCLAVVRNTSTKNTHAHSDFVDRDFQSKNNPKKIIWTINRVASTAAVFLITYFGMMGASMGGYGFSNQGNALTKALDDYLIVQGVCKDFQTCQNALQMYREDSRDCIYLNMYRQTDTALASTVTAFLVARGLKITGGMAITLHVYSGSHEQYADIKRIFGQSQQSIKLELNK